MRKILLIIAAFETIMFSYIFAGEVSAETIDRSEWHGDTIYGVCMVRNQKGVEWYENELDSIRKLPLVQLNPKHDIDNLTTVLNSLTPKSDEVGWRVPNSFEISTICRRDTVWMSIRGISLRYLLSKKRDRGVSTHAGIYVNKIGEDSAFFLIKVPIEDFKFSSQEQTNHKADSLRTAGLFKFSSDSVLIVRSIRQMTTKTDGMSPDYRAQINGYLQSDSKTGTLHFVPTLIRIPEQRLFEYMEMLKTKREGEVLLRKGVCKFNDIR